MYIHAHTNDMNNPLEKLVRRLERIGITLELEGNYPWIYMRKVNGKRVLEKFHAVHGFTIATQTSDPTQLTDKKEIFRTIRKYL